MIDDVLKNEQVVLDGKTYTIDEFSGLNPDDLVNEFGSQAARYMYIATLETLAEERHTEAKSRTKELFAIISLEYRESGIPEEFQATTPKMTEGFLDSLVNADSAYLEAVESENTAYADLKKMRVFARSMHMRGEMLISLGATLRKEWEQIGISAKKELQS